mmetsp:Transcript_20542/g.43052  ORF Transcript_20542/g.43052 Transcript_20542/m.43052 type:complete len:98 (-) Transcript_20542:353-646(-)
MIKQRNDSVHPFSGRRNDNEQERRPANFLMDYHCPGGQFGAAAQSISPNQKDCFDQNKVPGAIRSVLWYKLLAVRPQVQNIASVNVFSRVAFGHQRP